MDVDLGWDISVVNQRIRLFGIDCEESRTRDLEEKKYGLAAKAFLQDFFSVGSSSLLRTREKGKYGRYLGDTYQTPSGRGVFRPKQNRNQSGPSR